MKASGCKPTRLLSSRLKPPEVGFVEWKTCQMRVCRLCPGH
jgi:hypothetical protein